MLILVGHPFTIQYCPFIVSFSNLLICLFANYFAAYDNRAFKRYEGPCKCPEEVSLTTITGYRS